MAGYNFDSALTACQRAVSMGADHLRQLSVGTLSQPKRYHPPAATRLAVA